METFFTHNTLQINYDDFKSAEDYLDAIGKLNSYEAQQHSLFNSLNNQIIEKRKVLSAKYEELLALQQEEAELKRKSARSGSQRDESLEDHFLESLNLYLLDYRNIFCNNEQKINRVTIDAELDLGNHFAIYIEPNRREIQKICVIKDDPAKTEKELSKEDILSALNEIGEDVAKEIQKIDAFKDNQKMSKMQLGSIFLEYYMQRD